MRTPTDPRRAGVGVLVGVALVVAALAVTFARGGGDVGAPPAPATTSRAAPIAPAPTEAQPIDPVAEQTARTFVGDYLARVYGAARSRRLRGAVPALRRQILAARVPPGVQGEVPTVDGLALTRLESGAVRCDATVTDPDGRTFGIAFRLEPTPGEQWDVSRMLSPTTYTEATP